MIIHKYKGIVQSIDGLIGLSIFSIAFIMLISTYMEFGYSSNSSLSYIRQYISKESNMQHTIHILEDSDSTFQNFRTIMQKSGYGYSLIKLGHYGIVDQKSFIRRMVVVDGRIYVMWVN